MVIDKSFYALWENIFKERYFNLRDPEQNAHSVRTIRNKDGDYVFYIGVQYMVEFYWLEDIHVVLFSYAGTNFFDIRIVNNYGKEITYPKNGGCDRFNPSNFDDIEDKVEVNVGWTIKVTKAIEGATNPLPIPSRIVKTILKEGQQMVYIFDEDGNAFSTDLRRGRSWECYLGRGWYQYVRDKKTEGG
ncbi:DNA-binding barrel domain superfamily [Sesbania bispinosa]|nr:DNA-binding barrel domain superfamily [Sesbania bispinosa]